MSIIRERAYTDIPSRLRGRPVHARFSTMSFSGDASEHAVGQKTHKLFELELLLGDNFLKNLLDRLGVLVRISEQPSDGTRVCAPLWTQNASGQSHEKNGVRRQRWS